MGLFWIYIILLRTKVVAKLLYEDFGMDRYFAIQPVPIFRNQHILMVGDSLLRYQYVSLVHLLSKGEFPDKLDPDGKILQERMFSSWAEFFTFSNGLFSSTVSGSEVCDCHRDQVWRSLAEVTENRYFRDRKNNFSITYIQYFGDTFPLHGNYRPRSDAKFHAAIDAGELLEASTWSYDTVQTMLTDYATKLVPAPTVLLLNAGFHKENYVQTTHRNSVLTVAKTHFPRFIWKTTNARLSHLLSPTTITEADALICATPGIQCMNLNWTYYLAPQDYVDPIHFTPQIYTDVNIQFIRTLESRDPPVYSPLPASYQESVITVANGVSRGQRYFVDHWGRLLLIPKPDRSGDVNSTACISEAFFSQRTQHTRSTAWLENFVTGPSLVRPDVCEGDLVRAASEKSIFLIQDARRREFASWQAFAGRGYDLDQVKVVVDSSHLELYPLGEPLT
jgi:hypothetical protein